MTIAILAGGFARRLGPLTTNYPKALLACDGVPFAVHQIKLLKARGVTDLVFCLGQHGDLIVNALGDGAQFGVTIRYSDDGAYPLGTGGAILKALPLLGEHFLVLYGDVYLDTNYQAVLNNLIVSGCPAIMAVTRKHHEQHNVSYASRRIVRYDLHQPDPGMHWINAGVSAFTSEAFAPWPAGSTFDLDAVFQRYLQQGLLAGVDVDVPVHQIGTPNALYDFGVMMRPRADAS